MILLLDQDGVLADFDRGFLQAWQKKYPERSAVAIEERRHFLITQDYPAEWKQDVQSIYTRPGFIEGLPPIDGAIDAYRELNKLGFEVWICTSPLLQYEHCVAEKFKWVEFHLGRAATEKMLLTRDKTLVDGDVLIDDKPVISGLKIPHWQHILFDAPYNRHIVNQHRMTWQNWQSNLAGWMYQVLDT